MRRWKLGKPWIALGVVVLVVWVGAGAARPQEPEGEEDVESTGVKKYGFVHNIAEDRKLVKVGGVYEPEGLDLYLKRLFDGLSARLLRLEDKIDRLDKRLAAAESTKPRAPEKSE